MSLYPSYLLISSKRYRPEQTTQLPRDKHFVRVLHELELASHLPHTTPPGRPEVRAMFPNHHIPFRKPWQLKSKAMNPLCSPANWSAGYHHKLWIANDHGMGDANDPRANYVTGENLTSPLPRVEALTCGGNLLSVIGEALVKTDRGKEACYIIETLDYSAAPPDEIPPWLVTTAVNMGTDGTPRRFEQARQPNGFIPGFFHPLLADPKRFTVAIPKWRVVDWAEDYAPDVYRVYL